MLRAAIYERDWHPSCIVRRSSSSSVVHVCDNRRLVAIKTAFVRLTNSWRTARFIEGRHETIKVYPAVSVLFMTNLLNANSAESPSTSAVDPQHLRSSGTPQALAGNGLSEVVSTSLHFSEEWLGFVTWNLSPHGVEY